MYCEHCGKELTGGNFCEHCGKPIEHAPATSLPDILYFVGALAKKHVKLIIVTVLALAVVSLGITAVDYLSVTINPMKYVDFEVSGFSTHGYVDVLFDEEDELQDMILQTNTTNVEMEGVSDSFASFAQSYWEMGAKNEILDLFDIYVLGVDAPNGQLSNGDTFTVEIEVNREGLETYGYHAFKDVYQKTFTVGKDTPKLTEPAQVDFFQYVAPILEGDTLTVSGMSDTLVLEEPVNGIYSIEIETKPYTTDETIVAVIRLKMCDENGYKLYSGGIAVETNKMNSITINDELVLTLFETDWVEEKGISITSFEETYKAKKLPTISPDSVG